MERMREIESPSQPWQGRIRTTKLHPHIYFGGAYRIWTGAQGVEDLRLTTWLKPHELNIIAKLFLNFNYFLHFYYFMQKKESSFLLSIKITNIFVIIFKFFVYSNRQQSIIVIIKIQCFTIDCNKSPILSFHFH